MKKELAFRIVQSNQLIEEQEQALSVLKDTIKDLKERRDVFLRELVQLVTEGEDDA